MNFQFSFLPNDWSEDSDPLKRILDAPFKVIDALIQQLSQKSDEEENVSSKDEYEPTEEDQQELEIFLNQKKEYEMITKEILREIQEYFTQFN